MKVLIFTTVWKRPEITELVYKGFDRMQSILKEEGVDSEVLVVSSEDSQTKMAKDRGYHVCETENSPLGRKYNNGMKKALELEWDYILEMNSNNLLSSLYVRIWLAAARENTPMFGSQHFYVMLNDRIRFKEFKVQIRGGLSGVGRGIRRDMIENCLAGEPGYVCPPKLESAIDMNSRKTIEQTNDIKATVLCRGEYPSVIDIKSETDMHTHNALAVGGKMKQSFFLKHWPEIEELL